MKHTILKLLLFINSCLLIAYIGMTTHADLQLNTRGVIPLFLSSLLLIDVIYVSSCNIRDFAVYRHWKAGIYSYRLRKTSLPT